MLVDKLDVDLEQAEANSRFLPLTLTGVGASAGKITGKAKVFKDLDPVAIKEKMEDGCILVVPHCSPLIISAMLRARAIVTDMGGPACHAAIVAREMGIPCVVNTGKATSSISEDMLLEVDGLRGIIRCILG